MPRHLSVLSRAELRTGLSKAPFPELTLRQSVTATRHTVRRLASHISGSTDDLCFFNLQIEGLGRTTQRNHEQTCAPGDLAVADTTEPFEIANCHNFKLFCFAVPRRLLPSGLLDRPRLYLSRTETGRALSKTLAGYAEMCLADHRRSMISAIVGAHVVDLIAHAADVLSDVSAGACTSPSCCR